MVSTNYVNNLFSPYHLITTYGLTKIVFQKKKKKSPVFFSALATVSHAESKAESSVRFLLNVEPETPQHSLILIFSSVSLIM